MPDDCEDRTLNFLDNYAMSRITETESSNTLKVRTKLLSNIINEYLLKPPYLIKIDTEGHELKIIKSFEKYLAEDSDMKLVVEILNGTREKKLIFDLMSKHKFKCEQIDFTNFYFQKS